MSEDRWPSHTEIERAQRDGTSFFAKKVKFIVCSGPSGEGRHVDVLLCGENGQWVHVSTDLIDLPDAPVVLSSRPMNDGREELTFSDGTVHIAHVAKMLLQPGESVRVTLDACGASTEILDRKS